MGLYSFGPYRVGPGRVDSYRVCDTMGSHDKAPEIGFKGGRGENRRIQKPSGAQVIASTVWRMVLLLAAELPRTDIDQHKMGVEQALLA